MKRLIVIQHCQSEHHVKKMIGGWTDTPLTDLGKHQAGKIADKLSKIENIAEYKIYSSDLLRTKETAQIISDKIKVPYKEIFDLREQYFGKVTNMYSSDAEKYKLSLPEGKNKFDHNDYPDAETQRNFYIRIKNCMDEFDKNNDDKLLIVTHGLVIENIMLWWLRLPVESLTTLSFKCSVGSLGILTYNLQNIRTIYKWNDCTHLE